MSVSYERLFGDTGIFAVRIGLGTDPTPAHGLDPALRESWGTFELWTEGRCLTRSVRDDGSVSAGVAWYLRDLLAFVERHLEPLLNEEPFPALLAREEIGDGADWIEASEVGPGITLTEAEQQAWFERRSDWFQRHSLRFAFPGAAVPQLLMRRVGEDIEMSWDNDRWPAPRMDLRFVEPRGSGYAPARQVARTLTEAARELRAGLEKRSGIGASPAGAGQVWNWLLPYEVREQVCVAPELAELRQRLQEHAARSEADHYCPHSLETWALRAIVADARGARAALEDCRPAQGRVAPALERLRAPRPPDRSAPWLAGYDAAGGLRRELGWGEADPAPDLLALAREHGIEVRRSAVLGGTASCALVAGAEEGAAVLLPSRPWRASEQMATAMALGHLLLDAPRGLESVHLDSPRAHWPSVARARAFAAMLLMPEQGVEEAIGRGVNEQAVRALSRTYGLGTTAVTWHLKNLGHISEEARVELAASVGAPEG